MAKRRMKQAKRERSNAKVQQREPYPETESVEMRFEKKRGTFIVLRGAEIQQKDERPRSCLVGADIEVDSTCQGVALYT